MFVNNIPRIIKSIFQLYLGVSHTPALLKNLRSGLRKPKITCQILAI